MRKMRPHGRLSLLVVLTLVAGVLALAAPAGAAGTTVDLIADQDIDVGDVTVTNDGTNLYVTFALSGGWCMTESHLAVATSLGDIPQTNGGNPKPGQFAYGDVYDPCATGDSFTIPLADIPAGFATPLVIAVHAKVKFTDVIAAGPSWATSVVASSLAPRLDGTAVLAARTVPSNGLVSDYTGGAITFFSLGFGGSLTAGFDCKVLNGTGDDIRIYEVTNGPYPQEKARVEASMDGTTWFDLGVATNTGAAAVRTSSFDLGALPYASFVRVTDTTNPALFVDVYDANTMPDGFDLDGIRALQDCVEFTYESAWGEGTEFPGSNWAMYFGYTVQGASGSTSLQPGWDNFPSLESGSVSWTSVATGDLDLTYTLSGAESNKTYTVGLIQLGYPSIMITCGYTQQVLDLGPFTREGQTVTDYNFWRYGTFTTDVNGDGGITVTGLTANSGTWNVQFIVLPGSTSTPSYESAGIYGTTVAVVVIP